eukprot:gnl/TRDRNA2_/TRDRNA2_174370_c2_seq1.p1 gnl/TRDRNA2_/TRDRNA2_174370_c2~~gnl/TRDRNA2_/TRDRNA2_174370_c2_seq1.p1  ORF type:complete len:594 (+),score=93.19 gnl/TRDRNA2_/TRDRNA2_174370_c2_seq1:92-1873(+)
MFAASLRARSAALAASLLALEWQLACTENSLRLGSRPAQASAACQHSGNCAGVVAAAAGPLSVVEDADGNLPEAAARRRTEEALVYVDHGGKHNVLNKGGDDDQWKRGFPPDFFTEEQRDSGGVILYVIGMVYMFIALAFVCDECFVPALEVVSARLDLSPDVASATLMTMGASAPELFTSCVGTWIAKTDVGIGTILGTVVFNMLFVIGCCAIASPLPLALSWWPLFRDSLFYCIGLLFLALFLSDSVIEWHESSLLFCIYVAYCCFMRHSESLEVRFKDFIKGRSSRKIASYAEPDDGQGEDPSQGMNAPGSGSGAMLSIVPAQPADTAGSLSFASSTGTEEANGLSVDRGTPAADSNFMSMHSDGGVAEEAGDDESDEETEDGGPLELTFPEPGTGLWGWSWFVLTLPIIATLICTVPDVRREGREKYVVVTLLISICWTASFTYSMVWFAHIIADACEMSVHLMGLTILAVGSSVPDFVTSVIVAKEGKGDMAVSSSICSNIFELTVGLPLPWLLYTIGSGGEAVQVKSYGVSTSITVLLGMLFCTFFTVKMNRWVMTKAMGFCMFALYAVFMTQAVVITVIRENTGDE